MEATPPGYYRAYAEKTGRNFTNCILSRYPVKSPSTREIIQFLSICFIVNRPKAKQIKWVKSDPVSAAFFLEITTILQHFSMSKESWTSDMNTFSLTSTSSLVFWVSSSDWFIWLFTVPHVTKPTGFLHLSQESLWRAYRWGNASFRRTNDSLTLMRKVRLKKYKLFFATRIIL